MTTFIFERALSLEALALELTLELEDELPCSDDRPMPDPDLQVLVGMVHCRQVLESYARSKSLN